METQQAKSKRQQNNDENIESKQCESQRLASPVKLADTMKITDVIDDCLVKIFEHLDLENLFNVANANALLRPAAAQVYKRKFGKMRVNIEGCDIGCIDESFAPKVDDKMDMINIRELKTCLMHLRCFGPCITDLLIDYGVLMSMSKRYEHVHQYINDYCAESLNYFAFYYMQKNATIEQFKKGFANVKEVRIFGNCLVLQNPSFVEWFPELRDLKLIDLREYCLIEKPLQHLEHSRINIDYDRYSGLATETIAADLLALIKHCTHQASIELSLPNYRLEIDDIIALTQLKSLKKFMFEMSISDSYDDKLVTELVGEWKFYESKELTDYNYGRYTRFLLVREMKQSNLFNFCDVVDSGFYEIGFGEKSEY